jgi:AraC-like DNA-binding protein
MPKVWLTTRELVLYGCNMISKNPTFHCDWVRFQSTHLAPVTLMHAHFVEHSFEKHSHETFSICLTSSGVQSFRCRGEELSSVRGKIVAFNPDEAHDGHRGSEEAFEYAMLYIEPSFIYDLLRETGHREGKCHIARPLIDDPASWLALHRAIDALQQPNENLYADVLLNGALLQFFGHHGDFSSRHARKVRNAPWIYRARDYIEEHYAENITVDDLAHIVQVSRVHVTRSFVAIYGVSPHVYLNSVRVNKATKLLLAGRSAADVAAETGFADQSHFTKRFKGCIGLPPAIWAKQMQQ